MRNALVLVSMSLLLIVAFGASAQGNKAISVLIIDGFSNHDWKQTTKVVKWILERRGQFHVDVSTVPSDSNQRLGWIPEFTKYDVVVQNTNNIHDPKLRWPPKAEKALAKYVKDGGGLYVLHSANNAFPHWEEYNDMIGLGWRPKSFGYGLEVSQEKQVVMIPPGDGNGTGHGDRFNALVQILNRHPINKNYPDDWQTANTEVYYFPRGPAENLTVLSYAYDSTGTQRHWPVEWVISYGKGRVYNSSMGHLWRGEIYPQAYRCVGFQTTMIRATEWLATGKVEYRVPENFPSKFSISLYREDELTASGTN